MGEFSKIGWTDHTWNPWRGCTKVGPGCDPCYAAARDERYEGGIHWGPGAPRVRAADATRLLPYKLQKQIREGKIPPNRRKVFTLSLGDAFDKEIDRAWREEFWKTVRDTPDLRYQITTKRIGNVPDMLPPDWPEPYRHVGFLATMVNQQEIDRDLPKLAAVKIVLQARWVGISIEPQIEHIDIVSKLRNNQFVDWIITGGESLQTQGADNVRLYDIGWPRSLILQCCELSIPCFVKQLGSNPYSDGHPMYGDRPTRFAHSDPDKWPADLRVQQFPEALAA